MLTEYVQERLARLLAENRPRRAQPDEMTRRRDSADDRERRPGVRRPVDRRSEGRTGGPPEFAPSDDLDIDEDPLGWAHGPSPRRGPALGDGAAAPLDEVDDWADPPQRRFNRTHVGVVVVLLILGSLFAGWSVLRAHPVAIASTSVGPASSASGPAGSGGSGDPGPGGPSASPRASSPPVKKILVHVLGAVTRPGVVSLPERARVLDAIRAAGGLKREAAPGDLNLAQVLTDGEQVLIGTREKPSGSVRDSSSTTNGSTDSGSGSGAMLDLNGATETQLEDLPGVGPVTAGKIVAWRTQHTRFSRVEELQEVDGIGPKTYAQIAPHVRV